MNADVQETVKALRCCGIHTDDKNCGDCPVCSSDTPCPDLMPHAADLLESLSAELTEYEKSYADVIEIRDRYATAARAIHLWLKDFCNEKLPYPEMIEDAARKVAQALDESQEELDVLHERLGGELPKHCRDCDLWGKAGWGQYQIGYCEGDDHPHKGTDFCNRWRGPDEGKATNEQN
jgi:hypothetical protein